MIFGIAKRCEDVSVCIEVIETKCEMVCEEFAESAYYTYFSDLRELGYKWYRVTFKECWDVDGSYDSYCALRHYVKTIRLVTVEELIRPFTEFSELVSVVLMPLIYPWFSKYNLVLPYAVWYRDNINPCIVSSGVFRKLIKTMLRGYAILLDDVAFLALPRDLGILEKILNKLKLDFLVIEHKFNGILIRNRDTDEYIQQLLSLLEFQEGSKSYVP